MNVTSLITLAELYASRTGLKLSTVSTYAAGGGRFFRDLKAGSGCTVKTANTLLSWFAENWPDDLDWPDDIPHPTGTKVTS